MSNNEQEKALTQLKEALAVVQEAMQKVEGALASAELADIDSPALPANAGSLWTPNDEKRLIADYKNGLTVRELCEKYERTFGGIQSRLLKFANFDGHEDIAVDESSFSQEISCLDCEKSIPVARITALLGRIRCTSCQEECEHTEGLTRATFHGP